MSDEQDRALLKLPFDQYQRYRIAADLVVELGVGAGRTVLDVGGGPGLIEQFLPAHETFVLDVAGPFHGRFVLGSGAELPFPARAFGAAVALDTLEHVPPGARAAFLHELVRVADVVVVSAPFAGDEVELAEAALSEFVTQRFGGFATLEEHAEHGLPDLEASERELRSDGVAVATLPSGYLPRWLAGMVLHHELLATGVTELSDLHAYYNATVSPLDCREPSYRQVLVAARGVTPDRLREVVDGHRSGADTAESRALLGSIVATVMAQRTAGVLRSSELRELEGQLAQAQQDIEGLKRSVADREAHLTAARLEQERLREENDSLRRNLVNRAVTQVKRVLGSSG